MLNKRAAGTGLIALGTLVVASGGTAARLSTPAALYLTEPAENRGAYLVTEQGVMQLYTWSVAPPEFPRDALTLESTAIHSIAIVQKQFSEPEQYQLYNLSTNQLVGWQAVQKAGMKLVLVPDPLGAGQYLLAVPKDSMFGGKTNHYFRLQ